MASVGGVGAGVVGASPVSVSSLLINSLKTESFLLDRSQMAAALKYGDLVVFRCTTEHRASAGTQKQVNLSLCRRNMFLISNQVKSCASK